MKFDLVNFFAIIYVCLRAAQATTTLPSPEELHENSAPTVSYFLCEFKD